MRSFPKFPKDCLHRLWDLFSRFSWRLFNLCHVYSDDWLSDCRDRGCGKPFRMLHSSEGIILKNGRKPIAIFEQKGKKTKGIFLLLFCNFCWFFPTDFSVIPVKDSVNAIAFVALGTSVPGNWLDIQQDSTASKCMNEAGEWLCFDCASLKFKYSKINNVTCKRASSACEKCALHYHVDFMKLKISFKFYNR